MIRTLLSCISRKPTEPEDLATTDAGFTLIELMVVLLIIAILLAIAIPTFLGVTSSANDRAAQSNLTNGLTEATAQYQSAGQTYSGIAANLASSAPEYSWTAAGACSVSQPNCISVSPVDVATSGDLQGVVLAAMSKTGTCWWVAQLQANPANLTSSDTSGFIQGAAGANAGAQNVAPADTALITTAGTYYAKKANAGSNCNASYIESPAAGFGWGTSFSSAGTN